MTARPVFVREILAAEQRLDEAEERRAAFAPLAPDIGTLYAENGLPVRAAVNVEETEAANAAASGELQDAVDQATAELLALQSRFGRGGQ